MLSGWISIHRKIQDNWMWKEKPFDKRSAWIDILLMVNHEDRKVLLGSELIEVKRGSRITSVRQLCDRWGWSNTKVNNFLKLLEEDNMVIVKSDSKKTTLTVVNYNDYQIINDSKKDTKATGERQTSDTKTSDEHTNNNDNNYNNDNKDIYSEIFEFWNSKEIIQHKKLTDKMKTKIKSVLKDYDVDTLKEIISTYAEIIHDDKYYFTYKWSLEDFLQRGLKQFEKSDIAKQNFLKKEFNKPSNQSTNQVKRTKFHNFEQRSDRYTDNELDEKVEAIAERKRREALERNKKR